jgi:2-keto-3-deoxy-L-rhamnonate aldolase RhmA
MVCIDAEHAPFGRQEQDHCIAALRASNMPSLVRVPAAHPELLLSALDSGATGVVVPHVKSPDMAEGVVAAAHYGRGGRGYTVSTRAAGYSSRSMTTHLASSRESTVVVAQIEDVEGVDSISAIANVPGIDCLFVGRIDLTVAMGATSPEDPDVVAAVEAVCAAGLEARVPVGMFLSNLEELPAWKERGASLFMLSSDQAFIQQGTRDLVAAIR